MVDLALDGGASPQGLCSQLGSRHVAETVTPKDMICGERLGSLVLTNAADIEAPSTVADYLVGAPDLVANFNLYSLVVVGQRSAATRVDLRPHAQVVHAEI